MMATKSVNAEEASPASIDVLLSRNLKTIDTGRDGHTLSCGPSGDLLQLSCYHAVHGVIVASPFAQFDGDRFYDSEYVRAYRKKLLDYVRSGTRGFGLRFDGAISNLNIGFIDDQWIKITFSIEELRLSTLLWIGKDGEVIQSTVITSESSSRVELNYTLSLELSVNRASYGQLTEGGPIPIPPSRNETKLYRSGCQWAIINENLDAMVEGALYEDGEPVSMEPEIKENVVTGAPSTGTLSKTIQIHPGSSSTLTATFHLKPGQVSAFTSPVSTFYPPSRKRGWKLDHTISSLIIRRNLQYILGSCTFPVGDTAICFITDHVALPLGWNRDNYWQIRFLLDVYQNLDAIAHLETARIYSRQIRANIRGHLIWVFRQARRPHGYWHRSYLATGIPKDGPVFQLDQQCYPLLELIDFYKQFHDERVFIKNILEDDTIHHVLKVLERHRDSTTGLYKTEETPGDDAVEYPYHFSSHVLLWYTIFNLSEMYKSFPEITNVDSIELAQLAEEIRAVTIKNFVTMCPQVGELIFAYLTDGAGTHTFYHDANDIPTLFAVDWKFIDSPTLKNIWAQTMNFGLSALNKDGFYPDGEFGGLGSVHTRGPWPLGYAQEFIYANLRGDNRAQQDAWRRIQGAMFWDGLFPEAVDCHTGDCVSKAWFSWPGSMIGSALLRFNVKFTEEARI